MKRAATLLVLAALAAVAAAQDPVRIPVRHADPWMIKFFLEGQQIRFPEMSTMLALGGMGAAGGQAAAGATAFFTGGRLVVNVTDNSLWFFPDRK